MPKVEAPQLSFVERTGPREACGISAVFSKIGLPVTQEIPGYQHALRNRGRDAIGMAVFHEGSGVHVYKALGEAKDVFPDTFDFASHNLISDRGTGHGRYATTVGEHKDSFDGVQPITAEFAGRSITVAFNGNIPTELRSVLKSRTSPDLPPAPDHDTHDIARAIVSADGETWPERFQNALVDVPLAYSITMLTGEGDVYGLRCIAGTWPLWIGESTDKVVMASETTVDDSLSWREVKPGELVKATSEGIESTQLFEPIRKQFRCIVNDIYTADPDGLITEGVTYRDFRENAGRKLAQAFPLQADHYVGVPSVGAQIIEGHGKEQGVEPTPLIRKIEDTRSYISPSLSEAASIADRKLEIPNSEINLDGLLLEDGTIGDVVVDDDTLIKGTTSGGRIEENTRGYIRRLKEDAKARKVYALFATPKFTDDCDQGIFMETEHLAARGANGEILSDEALAVKQGADFIGFLPKVSVGDLYEETFGRREMVCMACMGEPHPLHQMNNKPFITLTPVFDRIAADD